MALEFTQRAIAKTLGVAKRTVERDLSTNVEKNEDDTKEGGSDLSTSVDLSGAEAAQAAEKRRLKFYTCAGCGAFFIARIIASIMSSAIHL